MSALEHQINEKAVRLAVLKAFARLAENEVLVKNCLMAAALVSRLFRYYGVPHTPITGYYHMDGLDMSFLHVWIATGPEDDVTDIVFSHPSRKILIMGQGFGFVEGAVRPTYTASAKHPVMPTQLTYSILQEQCRDLKGYLARAPKSMRDTIASIFDKAIDGSKELQLRFSPALLASLGGIDVSRLHQDGEDRGGGEAAPDPRDTRGRGWDAGAGAGTGAGSAGGNGGSEPWPDQSIPQWDPRDRNARRDPGFSSRAARRYDGDGDGDSVDNDDPRYRYRRTPTPAPRRPSPEHDWDDGYSDPRSRRGAGAWQPDRAREREREQGRDSSSGREPTWPPILRGGVARGPFDPRAEPAGDPRADFRRGDPRDDFRGNFREDPRPDPRRDPMRDPRGDPRRDPMRDPRADPRDDPRMDPRGTPRYSQDSDTRRDAYRAREEYGPRARR
jgi:hypothetical protein